MVKRVIAVLITIIWWMANLLLVYSAYALQDQEQHMGGRLASLILVVGVCVGLWCFGRWLRRKFKLGARVFWATALVSLLFTLILMYDWSVLEWTVGLVTAVVFAVLGLIIKKRPAAPDDETVINRGLMYINRLWILSGNISNSQTRQQVIKLQTMGKQILDFGNNNPGQMYKIDTFVDYYLPKSVELLEHYVAFSQKAVMSQNMQESMGKIANHISCMERSFEHCLNSLYGDTMLDIYGDIEAMKEMMRLEGMGE